MRKVFLFCICLFLVSAPVFAVTDSAIEEGEVDEVSSGNTTVIVDNSGIASTVSSLAEIISRSAISSVSSSVDEDDVEPYTVLATPVLTSVNVSNERISASDATGFKAVMLGLIGDYESIVTDYTYTSGSYSSHSIDITPDWSWLASCGVFVVVVYCAFRIVGGLFCSR